MNQLGDHFSKRRLKATFRLLRLFSTDSIVSHKSRAMGDMAPTIARRSAPSSILIHATSAGDSKKNRSKSVTFDEMAHQNTTRQSTAPLQLEGGQTSSAERRPHTSSPAAVLAVGGKT